MPNIKQLAEETNCRPLLLLFLGLLHDVVRHHNMPSVYIEHVGSKGRSAKLTIGGYSFFISADPNKLTYTGKGRPKVYQVSQITQLRAENILDILADIERNVILAELEKDSLIDTAIHQKYPLMDQTFSKKVKDNRVGGEVTTFYITFNDLHQVIDYRKKNGFVKMYKYAQQTSLLIEQEEKELQSALVFLKSKGYKGYYSSHDMEPQIYLSFKEGTIIITVHQQSGFQLVPAHSLKPEIVELVKQYLSDYRSTVENRLRSEKKENTLDLGIKLV